jgi:hypothetical protein
MRTGMRVHFYTAGEAICGGGWYVAYTYCIGGSESVM